MNHSIYIVIPIYNESEVIVDVIEEIKASGDYRIIIVDDGSQDESYVKASSFKDVTVLRHRLNRGKGAAIKTGVMAANRLGAEVIITMDGDGQHDPLDIGKLITPIIEEGIEVVLGTRRKKKGEMPLVKIVANKIGNTITWLLYGLHVSDSQSGFRAYSKYAAQIIDTKADKYEYDSKVIREIHSNRLSYVEIPIQVRYTEYSKGKAQKQGLVNGMKTFFRMIWDLIA